MGRNSGVTIRSSKPIGTAISEGEGLYANEIMNTRDALEREYGSVLTGVNLSVAKFGSSGVLGAYGGDTVYLAEKYAKNEGLTEAMKQSAQQGFHPSIGNKTGAEAVTAHEIGHYLGEKASAKAGISQRDIVERASKVVGIKVNQMASKISEYARYNYKETIAEACADVYCNGSKANKVSRAIMKEIKSILKN